MDASAGSKTVPATRRGSSDQLPVTRKPAAGSASGLPGHERQSNFQIVLALEFFRLFLQVDTAGELTADAIESPPLLFDHRGVNHAGFGSTCLQRLCCR